MRTKFDEQLRQLLCQHRHRKHNAFDLRKSLKRHLDKPEQQIRCIVCLLTEFNAFTRKALTQQTGNCKPFFDRNEALCLFPVCPCVTQFSDNEGDLEIIRIHLQCIRLHLLFIKITDLTRLFIYFIANDTALSHENVTSLFLYEHMGGDGIFQ